jgi:CheY-like chemotaxis protein
MKAARKKVLLIEDDLETAALIAEELVDRGYEISIAYGGRQGLAAILSQPPDLVLADVSMPVMSGFEVLERLIAAELRTKKIPFVFLSRPLSTGEYFVAPKEEGVVRSSVYSPLDPPAQGDARIRPISSPARCPGAEDPAAFAVSFSVRALAFETTSEIAKFAIRLGLLADILRSPQPMRSVI